jgi:tRNA1Val (adenine37-N6)-methyltransferase
MHEIFKFKQFEIRHGSAGLKVNTDAILCGTWAEYTNDKFILDIGTGCGIIALIAAQKSNAEIHALEIEELAALEAIHNFKNCKWKNRLYLFKNSLQNYKPQIKYSHIISNPPYFIKSVPSVEERKKIAKHTHTLQYQDIFEFANQHLIENGKITLIFPYTYKTEVFSFALTYNLYPAKICVVSAVTNKKPFRIVCQFTSKYKPPTQTYLTIMENSKTYSKEYISLCKEFYTFM